MTVRLLTRAGGPPLRLLARIARTAGRSRALPAVLAAAGILLAALAGYFGLEKYQHHRDELRRQEVLAAARQSVLNFTSLDYRHYERDSRHVLDGATGEFKKQFAQQNKQLTKLVAANKSVSQGQVLEAGIITADESSARVLVVGDSKVSNVAAPKGQARNYRLQLDLVREGGRWLTSDVEFVG
ncbi:hypothetical protein [Streptomyces sp. NPDC051776]|uniref:hypothetical protein n=1 Tax=Streptomyces sp. NPDC051776 TaxID=3155414 RepID=UPI003421C76E